MAHLRIADVLEPELGKLTAAFREAYPFRHVVIENTLATSPHRLAEEFPAATWSGWQGMADDYQRGKRTCADVSIMPELYRSLLAELAEPRFLSVLEAISGTPSLVPDPYLEGGGLHCTAAGGHLAPHTDFHWYERLHLFRRINVLIYLNPDWDPSWGGELQLFAKGDPLPKVSVAPTFGTCVIFQTDDISVHGVTSVRSPDGVERRSIATYYYTSAEAPVFSGDAHTHWQEHGDATATLSGRMRLLTYKALVRGSRALSNRAYQVNPRRRPKPHA